jgi:ribosomal-protein-alanine N-acetyltransferase
MILRGYEPGDLDAMHALDMMCFERPFLFARSAMRRFAEAPKARVVIAEMDGMMAGFGILHIEQVGKVWAGYIVTLDVDPSLRRSGIAGAVMHETEALAAKAGCSMMALHVFVGNASAIAFYERLRYVLSHRVEAFYGPGLDAWVFQKPLPA